MADVIRVQRSGGYTVLPNGILRDTGLSLKTKGLFAIILSLPEGWDYSVAGLATVAGCGRDAIRSALKEMEAAGYLTRRRAHGEGGKFTGVVYTIRDVAAPLSENPTMDDDAPLSGKPTTDNPTSGKPSLENPTQLNNDLSSKDLSNTPLPPKGGRREKKGLDTEAASLLATYAAGDPELTQALDDLMEVRTAKKAVNSPRAIATLLNQLDRLAGSSRAARLQIVQQSVTNSWKSVFPLKGGQAPPREEAPPYVVE